MIKAKAGRPSTLAANKSKIRDSEAAFKRIEGEVTHIRNLLHSPEGEWSHNVKVWGRARVQTALERLIESSIELMRINLSAMNSAKHQKR